MITETDVKARPFVQLIVSDKAEALRAEASVLGVMLSSQPTK